MEKGSVEVYVGRHTSINRKIPAVVYFTVEKGK